jgi:hypothetical protein
MASAERTQSTPVIAEEALANAVADPTKNCSVPRSLTIPGRDPFAEIEWEIRDAYIPGKDRPVFEQKGVEFPRFWSQTATNIVAQKYFRGRMASPERETSVKQMIGRVVETIGRWGRDGGYFADEADAETFEAELGAILVNQLASFNSPVWFNVGFEEKPQCSACMPYHQMVSTPDGMISIGQLVEEEQVGRQVCACIFIPIARKSSVASSRGSAPRPVCHSRISPTRPIPSRSLRLHSRVGSRPTDSSDSTRKGPIAR